MKVTGLKFRTSGLFSVTLEGCPPMVLEDISVYKLGLAVGMEVSEELFREIVTLSGREGAKYSAARLLTAGRKTKKDLIMRLKQKGFSSENADFAAEFFEQKGVLNDASYAEAYVKDAVNIKKYSLRMIKQKLALKGIDHEIISDVTTEVNDDSQLFYLIEKELLREPDKQELDRFKRRLCSKGFNLWDITRILGEFDYET